MICTNCKNTIVDTASFCPYCGQKVMRVYLEKDEKAPAEAPAEAIRPQTPVLPQQNNTTAPAPVPASAAIPKPAADINAAAPISRSLNGSEDRNVPQPPADTTRPVPPSQTVPHIPEHDTIQNRIDPIRPQPVQTAQHIQGYEHPAQSRPEAVRPAEENIHTALNSNEPVRPAQHIETAHSAVPAHGQSLNEQRREQIGYRAEMTASAVNENTQKPKKEKVKTYFGGGALAVCLVMIAALSASTAAFACLYFSAIGLI